MLNVWRLVSAEGLEANKCLRSGGKLNGLLLVAVAYCLLAEFIYISDRLLVKLISCVYIYYLEPFDRLSNVVHAIHTHYEYCENILVIDT